MWLALYRLVWKLGFPFIQIYLWNRKRLGKEDPYRFEERLGVPSLPRPNSKLIWIHCASVGESASVLPLIEELLAGNAWVQVMVTTGTVTSAYLMGERLPSRAFHQYVPIDKPEYVEEFIEYWQPDLAIWVESEFWPNLMLAAHASGCPMVLLNGRVSDKSYKMWMRYKSLTYQLMACFNLCLAQSREDLKRLRSMGVNKAKYVGNLKYGAPPLPYDAKALADVQKMIGNRMVWLAASTHPGEEEIILRAHDKIREKNFSVLTIIVPRHPKRGEEIRENFPDDVNTSLRSNNEKILEDTEIYIADTIGELGLFYRIAPIVFVGGSLASNGGHNPIEPAHLDCAVITGPNMQNFDEIMREFWDAGAVKVVHNADELAKVVFELWQNPQIRTSMAKMAAKHVEKKTEILALIIDEIESFL